MTRQHTITIDHGSYALDPMADLGSLRDDVERAVRDGGAFVSIPVADSSHLDVLITPGLLVNIESHTVVEIGVRPETDQRTDLGFDDLLEF